MFLKQRSSFVLFMHRFVPVLTVLLAVFSISVINLRNTPVAHAATNNTVNFQARLQSASGAIVPDGNYNIQFKLYSASSGGSALWTENYYNSASQGARTVNGYFNVKLGSVTAFPSTINWDQELWLTMNVGGTVTSGTFPGIGDGEMDPRLKLTAVPYAISAGQLQTTDGSYTSKLGIQAPTGGNQVFQIQDQGAAGTYNLLTDNSGVQLQTSTPGTAQTGNFNISGTGIAGALQAGSGGFYTTAALTLDTSATVNFHTPGTNGDGSNGANIATKINIPIYNPGAYGQLIALGLPSTADYRARAITVLDARTSAHQPTIAILSPDEGQIGGLSWDGSNSSFSLKTSSSTLSVSNSGSTGLRLIASGSNQLVEFGDVSSKNGVIQLDNSTNSNNVSIQAPSVSTSYITNLPTAIGTAGQCLTVASVASSTQTLGYGSCGGSITVGTIDSQTASSNGAVVSGTSLYLQSASFTNPGLVNTTTQTFTGDKVFKSTSNSVTAFQVQDSSSAAVFSVNTSAAGVAVAGNLTQTTGTVSLTGNAASQVSTTSGNLTLDSTATVNVGTTNATGVTLGNTSNTTAVLLQGSASATYTIGTSSNTGGITLGNSTASNTINIGNATIAAGNTGTINIGTSSTSTGKTTVTIGSTNDGSALNLQAGTGNINLLTNSASASTIVKTNTNSTTAFQIQNASSAILFNADTSTGTITLGSSGSGNYITFTAGGGLESYGTARHGKSMVFSPEYTNAVLDAASDSSCSSANSGTLTSAYDATNYRNYYNWTSTSGSNQCYDVVVDVVLPNDFSSWTSSDPINLQALASNTSNAGYAIAIRNVTQSAWDGNYGSSYASPGSISTSWTDVASSSFSGTYNAGDRLSIKIRMTAKSSANLQLGNLTLNYNSKW